MKRFLPFIMILTALSGCKHDDFEGCGRGPSTTLYPNMDLGEARALYDGSPSIVNADVILAGYVTANDLSGNFYRTFIIEDESGAIEVRAGLYDLKNLFPLGRYIAVKAGGLTVSDYNNVLQIGLAPTGGSTLPEYFGHPAIVDRYVYRTGAMREVSAQTKTIPQLSADLSGRLVTVEGLQLKPGEETVWASQDTYTGYSKRVFVDPDAREITVITSKYADFAGKSIPASGLSITGILMKEKNSATYALKMRSIEDVSQD